VWQREGGRYRSYEKGTDAIGRAATSGKSLAYLCAAWRDDKYHMSCVIMIMRS
jgi:hypothetical protein